MNEFEWRRQLRELRQPQTPKRDLWSSIEAALDKAELEDALATSPSPVTAARHRRYWVMSAAVAATCILAIGIAWHAARIPSAAPVAAATSAPATWKPSDPRLAGAAIELDAARMELKLALEQSPDSAALQRLLDRTKMQQNQLRQLADQAG